VFVPAHLLPAAAHWAHHQRDIQDVAEGGHCGSMEEKMEAGTQERRSTAGQSMQPTHQGQRQMPEPIASKVGT
jgi:hypothetical protein